MNTIVEKYITGLKNTYFKNEGTSQLFIDFSSSEKGKKGQIIRFLHDPDSFNVIADNFEEYLKKVMDHKYNFIHSDIM